MLTRSGSRYDRENVVVEDVDFMRGEVALARRLSTQYPPSNPDVRFGARGTTASEHARALEALAEGEVETARRTLVDHTRRVIDPEVLNDLAVLSLRCGDAEAAVDLLRALVRIHPDDRAAAANLVALEA